MVSLGATFARTLAVSLLLGGLEVFLASRSNNDLVDRSSELFPSFDLSTLIYSVLCFVGVLLVRPVLRSVSVMDGELLEQSAVTVTGVSIASLIVQDLAGLNIFSLGAISGVLQSLALGAGAGLFLVLVRESAQQRFSAWFDRCVAALAICSTGMLPWIALRPGGGEGLGFLTIDTLYILGLLALAVLIASRLGTRLQQRSVILVAGILGVVGAIAFVQHDPFLHFAPRTGQNTEHELSRVILISVDSLRRDALSTYGGETETPNMDQFAEDSVLFENAYAGGPWTVPSLVSIHTGVPVLVHGISQFDLEVPAEYETLAERMTDAGYHSGAIVANPNLIPELNLVQGFHDYSFFPGSEFHYSPHEPFGRKILRKLVPDRFSPSTTRLTDLTIEWLGANSSRDFFLWLHYFDPHHPFTPPGRFQIGQRRRTSRLDEPTSWKEQPLTRRERAIERQLYDGEVRYVDHEIGRVIAALKSMDIYEDALIILTSDHGEEFWDHGDFFHGHTVYNELLQVPLIVKLPRSTNRGRIEQRVSNQFVMGTVLESCGIPPRDDRFEFPSLLALLEGKEPLSSLPPIVASGTHRIEPQETLISEQHKIINREASARTEFYDLQVDAGEQVDLAGQGSAAHSAAAKVLEEEKTRLEAIRQSANITIPRLRSISPSQLERLKALGYVQ